MLRLVMRQVVLLATLEITHVVQTEDSTIAVLRLAMLVMLHASTAMALVRQHV